MKTVKSAFTIPPSIFEEAKQAAKSRGMNYSEFVVFCINAMLTGQMVESGGEPVPSSLPGEISTLRSIVDSLTGRISALETAATPEIQSAPIPLVEIPELPEGEKPLPREVAPTQAVLIHTHEEEKTPETVIPAVIPKGEKIQITAEVRDEMMAHFNELNAAGMTDADISRAALGKKTSIVALIRYPMDNDKRQKTLPKERYQALMSVKKDSS